MPAVSKEDEEATRAIAELNLGSEIYCSAHGTESAINTAVSCGVCGISMGVPTGHPRLKYQFPKWTEDEPINIAMKGITYAKGKGLKVKLFLMDSSRSEKRLLERMLTTVCNNTPPDSVVVVATAGCLLPQAAASLVRFVKELTTLPIEIHMHNDMGLGLANTLAAIEAGAEVLSTTINGLGEASGCAATEEVIISLRILYNVDLGFRYEKLYEVSKLIQDISRVKLQPNKAIVGENAFLHESGLVVAGYLENPYTAEALNPEFVGQKSRIVLGKMSGSKSVIYKLKEIGVHATNEQIAKILQDIKEESIKKKRLISDEEFNKFVKRYT